MTRFKAMSLFSKRPPTQVSQDIASCERTTEPEKSECQPSVRKPARLRNKVAATVISCLRKPKILPQPYPDQQEDSPFFKLPLEIREYIYDLALSPDSLEDRKPHFHVYDTIYDSCTYECLPKCIQHRRQQPTRMSLVMTCQAIYNEAVQFLYEREHFTLVLFAGRARPRGDLGRRNCLGSLRGCQSVLQRMRYVTLVVQPGEKPKIPDFSDRIAEFLEVIEYGRHMRELCLLFNFRQNVFFKENDKTRVTAILNSFYILGGETSNSNAPDKIVARPGKLTISIPPQRNVDPFIAASLVTFQQQIAGRRGRQRWQQKGMDRPSCILRGSLGQMEADSDLVFTSDRANLLSELLCWACFGVWLVVLPVSGPWTFGYWVRRKRDKGEW